MHRHLSVALSAATAVAAFGLAGCSHSEPKVLPSTSSAAVSPTSSPLIVTAPPTAPLPVPEALVDMLNRLVDPALPGMNKINLVEGATPESAVTLDKFITALRDNGYLPMSFVANNIAWSDKNPSNVVATVTVNTAKGNNGTFTFPMEFAPFQGGWQLSRRTAEMLLALGNSPAPTPPPPTPAPAPPPEPAPAPAPPPESAPPPEPAPAPAPAPESAPPPEPAPAQPPPG
jgi:outer membrane biosynthesis protein TonB